MPEQREAAMAYQGGYNTFARLLGSAVLVILAFMMFSNLFFRDYKAETVDYLRKADPGYAEKMLEKSPADMQEEQQKQLQQFEDIAKDVQLLKNEVAVIQQTIKSLQLDEEPGQQEDGTNS